MRIVVISASHMPYAPFVLTDFLCRERDRIVGLVLIRPRSKGRLASGVVAKAGLRYFLVKAVDQILTRTVKRWSRGVRSVESTARGAGIPVHPVVDINDPASVALLRGLQADVLYSVFSPQIFSPAVLDSAPMTLNYHPGKLPELSGTSPIFWALAEGETRVGVTLHHMAANVDEGDIFLEDDFAVRARDRVARVYMQSCELGARMLLQSVELIDRGDVRRVAQDLTRRRLYRAPDRAAYQRLRDRGHRLL